MKYTIVSVLSFFLLGSYAAQSAEPKKMNEDKFAEVIAAANAIVDDYESNFGGRLALETELETQAKCKKTALATAISSFVAEVAELTELEVNSPLIEDLEVSLKKALKGKQVSLCATHTADTYVLVSKDFVLGLIYSAAD